MRAVRDIQRLSLFPVVFTVGPVMSAALGDSYGEHCSSAMSEAESLLQDLSRQASPCSMWWQDSNGDKAVQTPDDTHTAFAEVTHFVIQILLLQMLLLY